MNNVIYFIVAKNEIFLAYESPSNHETSYVVQQQLSYVCPDDEG